MPIYLRLSILCACALVLGIIADILQLDVLLYVYIILAGSHGTLVGISLLLAKSVRNRVVCGPSKKAVKGDESWKQKNVHASNRPWSLESKLMKKSSPNWNQSSCKHLGKHKCWWSFKNKKKGSKWKPMKDYKAASRYLFAILLCCYVYQFIVICVLQFYCCIIVCWWKKLIWILKKKVRNNCQVIENFLKNIIDNWIFL